MPVIENNCTKCRHCVEKADWRKCQARCYCDATVLDDECRWGYIAADGKRHPDVSKGWSCEKFEEASADLFGGGA